MMIRTLLICLLPSTAFSEEAQKLVTIHLSGHTKKPGTYQVPPAVTREDLEKLCGGWTEFGSPARLTIVRFAREVTGTMVEAGMVEREKDEIVRPERNGKIRLEEGDLIFIPMKQFIGR